MRYPRRQVNVVVRRLKRERDRTGYEMHSDRHRDRHCDLDGAWWQPAAARLDSERRFKAFLLRMPRLTG